LFPTKEGAHAEIDPVGVLKAMAAEERNKGVFFVLVDQVHKIL